MNKLKKVDPRLKIGWDKQLATPIYIKGRLSAAKTGSISQIALEFFDRNKALFKFKKPKDELVVRKEHTDDLGRKRINFKQAYEGIPVYGGEIAVQLSARNEITRITGRYYPDIKAPKRSKISANQAFQFASKHAGIAEREGPESDPELLIYPFNNEYYLCWKITFFGRAGDNPALWKYFVDATSGKIVHRYNDIRFIKPVVCTATGLDGSSKEINAAYGDGKYYLRDLSKPCVYVGVPNRVVGANELDEAYTGNHVGRKDVRASCCS